MIFTKIPAKMSGIHKTIWKESQNKLMIKDREKLSENKFLKGLHLLVPKTIVLSSYDFTEFDRKTKMNNTLTVQVTSPKC